MRLIRRRFGDIPQPLTQQITKADPETLLLWGIKFWKLQVWKKSSLTNILKVFEV